MYGLLISCYYALAWLWPWLKSNCKNNSVAIIGKDITIKLIGDFSDKPEVHHAVSVGDKIISRLENVLDGSFHTYMEIRLFNNQYLTIILSALKTHYIGARSGIYI